MLIRIYSGVLKPRIRQTLCLFLFLLVLYAALPTRNHYWDGIGFALNIEGTPQDGSGFVLNPPVGAELPRIYYNPNHLLHNLLGYLLYRPLLSLFPRIRAHDVLVAVSSLLSAATCCLVFAMLRRWTANVQLSLWSTLLMAFSATWWKFATDVDTYIPPVFLLTLATWSFTVSRHILPAALLHALAMLLHQIAIFFLPAALYAVWRQTRSRSACLRYLCAAGVPVATSYAIVWFYVLNGSSSVHDFLGWLTSNGNDVYSHHSLGVSVLESGRSLIRLFFGGKLKNATQHISQLMLWIIAPVLIAAIAHFAWQIGQFRKAAKPTASAQPSPALPFRPRGFLLLWVLGYLCFLSFWLTEYPYYRLFCLPALVLLMGVSLPPRAIPLMRAFVVCMGLSNFTFYIYPYSKPEATPPVHLAMSTQSIWKQDELVLFKEFTCDNWIMKHFNPKTTWRQSSAEEGDRDSMATLIEATHQQRRAVWIDTSLLAAIQASPEAVAWMSSRFLVSKPWGISNTKHHIQFVKLEALQAD